MQSSPESSYASVPPNLSGMSSDTPLISSALPENILGPDDLSFSELSLTGMKKFTLLASNEPETSSYEEDDGTRNTDNIDEIIHENEAKEVSPKSHEEKLREDIFILKKLNASFAMFNDALKDSGLANQRVAQQLEQTDALLNKYISILLKSEDTARLVFDHRWYGADADEEILEREAREKAHREAEDRERTAQRELEKRLREEQESLALEKDCVDREKKELKSRRGAVRGVRGARASTRATRGSRPRGGEAASASQINRGMKSVTSVHAVPSGMTSRGHLRRAQ